MHPEWCTLPPQTAARLQDVRRSNGRVVAVGTTALRTLETAVAANGWSGWEGESRLFITPPYEFRAVDVLLTNFHLPKSTLLMLVSAFAGYELTRSAYAHRRCRTIPLLQLWRRDADCVRTISANSAQGGVQYSSIARLGDLRYSGCFLERKPVRRPNDVRDELGGIVAERTVGG